MIDKFWSMWFLLYEYKIKISLLLIFCDYIDILDGDRCISYTIFL